MENFSITKTKGGFHIEGFPDAVKVVRITGPKAQRLASLALHRSDLEFSLECMKAINETPEQPHVLREALWRSAIVHFMKCFGHSESRSRLTPKVVFKGDGEAFDVFRHFESLRNKNLIHDENAFTQCLPGAVLNRENLDHKIAKIICMSLVVSTMGQENYSNLHLLVTRTLRWVGEQFDELCDTLTTELEAEPYDELSAREGLIYKTPGPDDVHKARPKH